MISRMEFYSVNKHEGIHLSVLQQDCEHVLFVEHLNH